jgi:hypothetical protein
MPRLVLHDAGEELGQDRMTGHRGQPVVAGERRQLVDRSPRHVHGDEVRPALGQERRAERAEVLGGTHVRAPAGDRLHARGVEEARQGAAVEGLLVEPAGEEGGDLRIVDGARREERAQVDDGVALDVLHVAERPHGLGREGMPWHLRPVDPREVERAGPSDVAVEIEVVHALPYGRRRPADGIGPAIHPPCGRRR